MSRIYICCPANSYTGGPTLAHQLCYILNQNNREAYMWYMGSRLKYRKVVHERYEYFNNPYVIEAPYDIAENIVVSIESTTRVLLQYKNAKRIIWWLSVDNYYLNMGSVFDTIRKKFFGFKPSIDYCKKFQKKKRYMIIYKKDITHLVQSEYARIFLLNKGISKKMIFDLSDYLEDEILNVKNINSKREDNTILYNPKKGGEFTTKIVEAMSDIYWKPIINMSKFEVIEALKSSKLYIDFGNHPGKDRFPREAVACGCCIITGTRGAANNNVDIPIPQKYKFEDTTEKLLSIEKEIRFILNNYEKCFNDFKPYREKILKEKDKFIEQTLSIF